MGCDLSQDLLIAIVDDDPSSCAATSGLVRSFGYRTLEFGDAFAFLRSGAAARVGCLITDLRMPGMSGLELHLALTRDGLRLPTILVTAFANETTRLQAQRAGIACFLPKPIAADDLLACIRRAIASAPQ